MTRILITLVFITSFGSVLKAQNAQPWGVKPTVKPTPGTKSGGSPNITSTATAEECVKFIDGKVRKLIGQSLFDFDTVMHAAFTGRRYFVSTLNFPSSKGFSALMYQHNYSGINWGCYKSFSVRDLEKVMEAQVILESSCPYLYQFKTLDVINSDLVSANPALNQDTLRFYLPKAEKANAAELEKAFIRLSQIVKEKGDIFKTIGFNPKTISGKPSFSETVEFIQDNFPKEIYYYGSTKYSNGSHSAELIKKYIKAGIVAGTDSISISWYETLTIPSNGYVDEVKYYRMYAANFSMKDVESLDAVTWFGINGLVTYDKAEKSNFPTGIRLSATKGKPLIRFYSNVDNVRKVEQVAYVDVPFGSYTEKDNPDAVRNSIKDSRLYKALNHLRKLCGAPDPIEFD